MATTVKKTSHHRCSVPHCKTYYTTKNNVSMHQFPKKPDLLQQWLLNLGMDGMTIKKYMRVCSNHFQSSDFFFTDDVEVKTCKTRKLKLNSVPSWNLRKNVVEERMDGISEAMEIDNGNANAVNQMISEIKVENVSCDSTFNDLDAACTLLKFSKEHQDDEKNYKSVKDIDVQVDLFSEHPNLVDKGTQTEFEIKTFEDKSTQANTYDEFNKFDIIDIIDSNYKAGICTGVANLCLLNALIKAAESVMNSKKYSTKNKVLLTLIKLKLDLSFRFLAILFCISESSCRKYFADTCVLLSSVLKKYIRFPSKEEIVKTMPKCFEKCKNVRVILNSVEINVEKTKALHSTSQSNSEHVTEDTCKFLIGLAPSGMITYTSKAYGGTVSDKLIFNKENIIDLLLPEQDAIIVNKGFLIEEECNEKLIQLIRPSLPGASRKQLEVPDTTDIARARIHIERSIQKIKLFGVFKNKVTHTMLPYINNIMNIVVGVTNLSDPILDNSEFFKS